jgi:uncharacterized protein YqjF (DUF2071 family)
VRSAECGIQTELPYLPSSVCGLANGECYAGAGAPRLHRRQPSSSEAARARLLSVRGEPLFNADWDRVLMIHYEVDPVRLQRAVPFALDLRDGRAFVSLVAFTLRGMRPRWGGRLAAWLMRPIATHDFLNVRTYVSHGGETGIYFMAEWLSNRLSVALGPTFFGLPYRHGRIEYSHRSFTAALSGRVADTAGNGALAYRGTLHSNASFRECEHGSLTEWLMERYVAFTHTKGKARFFRVWHSPWPQATAEVAVTDQSLLERHWPLFREASLMGANFSSGVRDVWMGRPHRLQPDT